ncbi:SRPBCC domain-containing protein [Bailinhaonella thermotolerans]|uniref:SRPBCC domain-containing protein n=1 Tax=Bailinhaonella thermotolerans TaxID=1070861 RepID=A0A3A4B8F8_9ACTN|nr:SRPBCC domain-containing protein [Bailinhaonella thermotolerans]RJL33974.1 SRPBCC domain-containing protein [Bailinhaonella thermotolerans]
MKITISVLAVLVLVVGGLYLWTRLRPHTIRTAVEIDASAARVWEILTDLPAYPEWNPFIVRSEGTPAEGERLRNRLVNRTGSMDFSPVVLTAEPGRELRWIGRFGIPGIVDGEHYFLIEPLGPGRVRLTQGETFTGVLVPFAGSQLDVRDGFTAMNEALKARAEAR